MSPTMTAPLIEVRSVSKTFGSNRVLKGVDLTLLPGEVHVLLGANGSGKSTLVKILAGYQSPDEGGSLRIRDHVVRPPVRKSELRRTGITFVHQDLALVPSLSVLENLALDWYAAASRVTLPTRRLKAWAEQALARHALDVGLRTPVERLSSRERVELALVRALEFPEEAGTGRDAGGPAVLVLDEATTLLDASDRAGVYAIMDGIARRGGAVLLITHDLDEAIDVGTRISALRDGRIAGEVDAALAEPDALARLIVGGDVKRVGVSAGDRRGAASRASGEVRGLRGGRLRDVSFAVEPGEVLGLVGQPDSGAEDALLSLFGACEHPVTGTFRLPADGGQLELGSLTPRRATARGIGLVPPNRAEQGGVQTLSVQDNITMRAFPSDAPFLAVASPAKLAKLAKADVRRFDVRPPVPRQRLGTLSGGNQQKVILAKWLSSAPRVMLLDEPTQGVDVAARDQLQQFVRSAAASGTAVLWHSLDLAEVALVCDRVLVFRHGRVALEMTAPLDKTSLANACLGTV
ncbi:MAG TPA: sugar ABC transporter ATP-binding protein [Capillimicrobium sp.]|nr:sugar ABC transporter ATP-binding protein [Capillimicrobium sp.]